ncbi:group II intron maturase-specific domain-containing protein [Mesorhizobium sp. M0195]|uniref:group II intron maturase-specific domain-containing protein n=1 Tax=Mesorhizobium sp. M0195 TaxID=2956910 RepID=UPI0033353AB3
MESGRRPSIHWPWNRGNGVIPCQRLPRGRTTRGEVGTRKPGLDRTANGHAKGYLREHWQASGLDCSKEPVSRSRSSCRNPQAGRRGQKTRRTLRRRQTDPASPAAGLARAVGRDILGAQLWLPPGTRIAPKAVAKFKALIRDMTFQTGGLSLPQMIKELKPYLIGWRGYFSFCQTPRVLAHPEAWIRRRLRMYLWRQWGNGHNRFKELRRHGVPVSELRLPPVHRRDSGACQDTRRSNRP